MYFKHPLILLALILLAIPVIVHLFKLQKFTKVEFTNVSFLKNITLKNRKSSQLKKFLVLASRLLMFLFLILAFAEPYFSKTKASKNAGLIVYLDNSYSMQAKESTINMFETAIQDLLKFEPNTPSLTLICNDQTYQNLSVSEFNSKLSNVNLSAIPFDYNNALLKISNQIDQSHSNTTVFIISDFQSNTKALSAPIFDTHANYNLVQLKHQTNANIYIDSVYVSHQNAENLTLTALVKQSDSHQAKTTVSLFSNNLLIAKSTVESFKNQEAEIQFTIKNTSDFVGKLTLEDPSLAFDNSLYFVIKKSDKINVLSIGAPSKVLSKLYQGADFNFNQNQLQNLDYTKIDKQQVIILNALDILPPTLSVALTKFVYNGGALVILPNLKLNPTMFDNLFKGLQIKSKLKIVDAKQNITSINYGHPLLNNVFEKQVKNFDYPSVTSYVSFQSSGSSSILKFANGDAFISQLHTLNGHVYTLAAPFDADNTFPNSPLIVPVFYNIAVESQEAKKLYYIINQPNVIKVDANLKTDDILSIKNSTSSFIPLQHLVPNAVILEAQDKPDKPGFYGVYYADKPIDELAFNLNRTESQLKFYNESELNPQKSQVNYFTNLDNALKSYEGHTLLFELWKLCLALALLFYITELLLLKFYNK